MISTSGSSSFTESPTFLSHFEMVPSTTYSPRCGTMIVIGILRLLVRGRLPQRGGDLVDVRQELVLHRGSERHGRHVRRGDAEDRRVEVLEHALGDDRRDFRADAERLLVLVDDHALA